MNHHCLIRIVSFLAVATLGMSAGNLTVNADQIHYHKMDKVSTTKQIKRILARYNANALVVINKGKSAQPRYLHSKSTDVSALPKSKQKDVAVTKSRLFPIASMQKVMTGIMVQQLIDTNRLSLSDSIGKFYPGFPHGKGTTVHELMTHQSGIKDLPPKDSPTVLTKQSEQLLFTMNHLTAKGSSRWQYANANFTLLAGIVSSVTGQTYQKRLTNLVIKPIGEAQGMKFANRLTSSKQVVPVLPSKNWNYAVLRAAWSGSMGADEMLVTPQAYWKFLNVFGQGGFVPIHNYTIHRNDSPTNYYGGVYICGHYLHSNGYSHGYASSFFINYKTHESILIFCNNLPYSQLKQLGVDLFQAYYHKPYPLSTIGTV